MSLLVLGVTHTLVALMAMNKKEGRELEWIEKQQVCAYFRLKSSVP